MDGPRSPVVASAFSQSFLAYTPAKAAPKLTPLPNSRKVAMSQPQQPAYQMSPPPPTPKKKGRSNGMALFLAICVAAVPVGIVVIGIVASIAIPNMEKFKSRSMQSEAKTKLAAAYTGQKSFVAEWDVTTSDLVSLGLDGIVNEGKSRYHVGFVRPANAQWATIGIAAPHDASLSNSEKLGVALDLGAPFETLAAQYCEDCVAEGQNFKIVAIGNIDKDATLDVWTIDQDRKLVNIVDDIKE